MKKYTIADLKKKEIVAFFEENSFMNERDICKIIALRLRDKADFWRGRSEHFFKKECMFYAAKLRLKSDNLHKKADKLFEYALTLPIAEAPCFSKKNVLSIVGRCFDIYAKEVKYGALQTAKKLMED